MYSDNIVGKEWKFENKTRLFEIRYFQYFFKGFAKASVVA